MSSITSEEVNYLIYRYLQEAGFLHSAYCFGQESYIARADIKASSVVPGALIGLLQKGLHYVSIETHLNEDGSEKECTRPFSVLEQHVCERSNPTSGPEQASISTPSTTPTVTSISTSIDPSVALSPMLPAVRGSALANREPAIPVAMAPAIGITIADDSFQTDHHHQEEEETAAASRKPSLPASSSGTGGNKKAMSNKKKSRSSEPMDIDSIGAQTDKASSDDFSTNGDPNFTLSEDVTFLRDGLRGKITNFACSPGDGQLVIAMGTGDGWLQMWARDQSRSLSLLKELDVSHSQDITTLHWKPGGKWLSVASLDGVVRLVAVTENGAGASDRFSVVELSQHHTGPVFAAKWSPSGSCLLTAGMDKSVAVWDLSQQSSPLSAPSSLSGRIVEPKRIYNHHRGPVMDVDWRTDDSFATCSVDTTIAVYNNWLEQPDPVQVFTGHKDEVNSISWDPTRTILASCSDDCTARLWKTSQSSALHVLSDHRKELYAIRWSPLESRSGSHWLATASLDTTVKLWDAESGKCVRTLAKHSDAVYSIAFSPDGDYLATGSRDSSVHIWSLREGMVIRSFNAGPGGVLDLSWTGDGHSLVAGSANDICVFDMKLAKTI